MSQAAHRVGLVLDPNFGERLDELSRPMHLWVLRSPKNEKVIQRLWAEPNRAPSLESGATLFDASTEKPENACETILTTIELHHGKWSHDPPLDVLEVFGVAATAPIREELDALGFHDVQSRAGGFVASRDSVS